jgi:adenine-specific DNA-methyltransferase
MGMDATEAARLTAQGRLDAARTQAERNRLGQFATPPDLATDVLTCARMMLPRDRAVRFLDPAIGTGSFYSALSRVFPPAEIEDAFGYEIDPEVAREARRIWRHSPLKVKCGDFTQVAPPSGGKKMNLLICNPPYVRHHHLSRAEKARLQGTTRLLSRVSLSGLTGLYGYFLCLSTAWMTENGLAGWLIPCEFMDVNYGRQIKAFLLDRVTLLRIHRFNPEGTQFKDALVSSAVVWLVNAPPPPDHSVEFTCGGTLLEPAVTERVSAEELRGSAKWTRFFRPGARPPEREGYRLVDSAQAGFRLADLFTVKRGLATGANKFFILSPEQAAEHEIPGEFLTPILPSSRHLPDDEIAADEKGEPILERKLYLVTCHIPENEVRAKHPTLWRYLRSGKEAGVHDGYLCKNRSPWYAQENRPPAPILCTYMGRKNNGRSRPFRFILNHSKATAANVFLMLYPTPLLQARLKKRPDLLRNIWRQLSRISINDLTSEGRVYGGGLYKLEPKELGNVVLRNIDA